MIRVGILICQNVKHMVDNSTNNNRHEQLSLLFILPLYILILVTLLYSSPSSDKTTPLCHEKLAL